MKGFLYIALLISLGGCSVGEIAPTLTGPSLSEMEIESTLGSIEARRSQIHDIKSLIRVRLRSGTEQNSSRYAVVYRRPSALRIEVFPLNGFYTISLLGVLGDSLVSIIPSEEKAYTGKPSKDVLKKVLGLPLTVDEIAALLLAEPPYEGKVNGVEEGNLRRFISADKRVYFEMTEPTRMSRIKLFDRDQRLLADAEYSDYRSTDSFEHPHHLSLKLIDANISAELQIQKIQYNTAPTDELFTVAPPENFSITALD